MPFLVVFLGEKVVVADVAHLLLVADAAMVAARVLSSSVFGVVIWATDDASALPLACNVSTAARTILVLCAFADREVRNAIRWPLVRKPLWKVIQRG